MKPFLLVTDDEFAIARTTEALADEASSLETWTVSDTMSDAAALVTTPIRGRLPDTVILGPDTIGGDGSFALAEQIAAHWPATVVVLIAEPSGETLRAAMRAGVRDVLDPADPAPEWATAIAAARETAKLRVQEEPAAASADSAEIDASRVVVVVSSKGGSGKTTVATNLAVGLAKGDPRSTVIIDLDLEFGDVANALQLTPDRWLPDVVFGPARNDTMVLKSFLTEHPSGLFAVCAPETPDAAAGITAEHIEHLVDQLAHEYRYVIVDTPPGLAEHTLAALDRATDIVYVCGLDVPSIRGMRKELELLGELQLRAPREHLVVNNADQRAGLTLKDVESTLGRSIDVVIPMDRAVRLATNEGVPTIQSAKRGRLLKAFQALVARVRVQGAVPADLGSKPRRAR